MEAVIHIIDEIGCFGETQGVQLMDVIQQVKKYPAATSYTVHINSPGGECETGFDIYNYLRSLGKPIKTVGSGMVASIATVIFMAGDERILRQGCDFMIHLPSGGIEGTADQIQEYSEQVKAVEKRLIDFYKKAINISQEAIEPLMRNETFLTGDQAKSLGFATESDVLIAAKAKLFVKPNINNNMNISKEDKSWLENLLGDFGKKISNKGKKVTALQLTGADGSTLLDFPDLADDGVPAVGDKATIDGKDAEGEIVMPTGETYVFAKGELTEIKPKEDAPAEDLDAANARIEELEAQLATAQADATTATEGLATLQKEFVAMKKKITSKFEVEKKDPAKKKEDESTETRSLLKKKD